MIKNKQLEKKIIWQFIALSYLSLFSFGLIDNSRGPLYPNILEDFNLIPSYGSWIFSLASFAGLITTLLGNKWLKAFGSYRALQYFILLQLIGTIGMGLSAQFGQHFSLLLLSSFIYGLSLGGIGVCANIMIAHGVDSSLRRQAYAGLHSMYGLASLLAPLIISLTYILQIKWYGHFYVISIVPACVFFLTFYIKPKADDHHVDSHSSIIQIKHVILPCLIFGLYVASEILVSSRLVYYLEDFYKWNKAEASAYLSIFFFTLLTGRFLFSIIKFPGKSFNWLFVSLFSSLIFFILGITTHPIFLALLGLTQSFFFPCGMDWLYTKYGKLAHRIVPYTLTSISIFLISMHFVVGLISSNYGIQKAMYLGPICTFLVIVLLIIEGRSTS